MKKIAFWTVVLTVAVSSVSFADKVPMVKDSYLLECDGPNCGRYNQARPLPAPEPRYAPTVYGPHALNIDFGVWKPELSRQAGPAAAGQAGDVWNAVGVAWNNDHIEYNLRSARGELSPIEVRLLNLGGAWGNSNGMGVKAPMLDSYHYPQNNQGGNSQVSLHNVPPGSYNLYVYGHGANPVYYGDYTLIVGNREQGRRMTSNRMDAIQNTVWVEGSQYVKFANIQVYSQEDIHIVIQPGAQVTDPSGRSFADAMICGLQLIPVQDDRPVDDRYRMMRD